MRWQGTDPATGAPYNDTWQGEADITEPPPDDPGWAYIQQPRDYFVWVTQDADTLVEVRRDVRSNFGNLGLGLILTDFMPRPLPPPLPPPCLFYPLLLSRARVRRGMRATP